MKKEYYQIYDKEVPVAQGDTVEEAVSKIPNNMALKTGFSEELDIVKVKVERYGTYKIKAVLETFDDPKVEVPEEAPPEVADVTAVNQVETAPPPEPAPTTVVEPAEEEAPPAPTQVLHQEEPPAPEPAVEVIDVPVSTVPIQATVQAATETPVVTEVEDAGYEKEKRDVYEDFKDTNTIDPSTLEDPDIED